jgi:hypothetical protein
MKILLPLLVLLTVVTGSAGFKSPKPDKRVEVLFNRTMEFADIVKIKLEVAQKGIVLDYQKLLFDENGKLKEISFKVDCKDGFSGSASNGKLTNYSKFGFFRDYSPSAPLPFGTGKF